MEVNLDQASAEQGKHHDGVEVRIVEGGRSGIFVGPKKGARGCPTVVGMDPTQLKSEEARVFLR